MKFLVLLIPSILFCVSCFSNNKQNGNYELTKLNFIGDWPREDQSVPDGFTVSPYEAYKEVASNKSLSLKHKWICYYDNEFYYIADSFGKEITNDNVKQHAVKVRGISP